MKTVELCDKQIKEVKEESGRLMNAHFNLACAGHKHRKSSQERIELLEASLAFLKKCAALMQEEDGEVTTDSFMSFKQQVAYVSLVTILEITK